ncbi:MAG: chemotaxis protein CheA [Desulfurella sp.]|uniref:histidine kinase n=1 Tax=Desulfurella multipotens TaxID=79269 RepID=A0A1G6HLX2_9BACT|nr:chemotaxis protein CheA [Desulfurella multipotens]PMP65144.1 MAG: chemotaxis protein CheA [Desulfurella multipotens]PMP68418.1 MAG: chemotaxis protein CheA [Desulfurella multipotens]PMP68549.1 MAG: chemotaxis protein CheA [Desulfurella multipotens]SDB94885.1 two-component system, chemotaxis family, sensor kinase CheA [Desulfurella multipotens]
MTSFNEMDEILRDFIVETTELLESLDEDLVALEKSPTDADLLNKVFRAFHTIKGSSSFLGFEKMTELTHKLEDLLNSLRRFELELTPSIMDAILMSVDKLKAMLEAIKQNQSIDDIDIEQEIHKLLKAQNKPSQIDTIQKDSEEKLIEEPSQPQESKELQEQVQESVIESENDIIKLQIEEIQEEPVPAKKTNLTDEELNAEIQKLLEQRIKEDKERRKAKQQNNKTQETKDTQTSKQSERIDTQTLTQSKVEEVESQKIMSNKEPQDKSKQDLDKQTIRVDVKKLDDLMDLAGELVLAKNRLVRLANIVSEQNENDDIADSLSNISSQITLVTTDLQMAIMKTRMVEIGKVFNKFPRVVRDICRDLNKEVNLVIEGAETELDKSIVEEINEPFVHLIRNAIDHGIESPSERIQKGKNKIGTLKLSASQEGNHIVISVEDDGRGMDKEKIKQKAIENGIITEQEASLMSENDIFNLVFLPGFSTANQVSSISGRGVGMDVVKTNIEKLNGIITIKSQPNIGTKIIIKIPLTLAIIQSLLVKVAGSLFAIPLANVIETVRIALSDIEHVQNKDVLRLRGSIVPLVYLGDILRISQGKKTLNKDEIYVVIVSSAEKQLGLVVDALVNQEEVVIKPLGNYLGKVKSIAGATIMGDGSVALILDVVSIVKQASKLSVNIASHTADQKEFLQNALVISNKANLEEFMFIKENFAEYNILFSDNIASLYSHPSSIVFLDLSMPNAIDLINDIRELPATKKSYIVGLSEDLQSDKSRFEDTSLNALIGLNQKSNIENIKKLLNKKINPAKKGV